VPCALNWTSTFLLNSDGQQFHKYEQHQTEPVTSNYCTQNETMTFGAGSCNHQL
jgi:hypothetical protein